MKMGKVCALKSCPSGRKKKRNPRSTPLSLSFFKPTTAEKLEKWQKSLGIALKPTECICHLHFKREEIKMHEKYYINGELKILPLGKKVLKEEAVPVIEHQFIPIPEDNLKGSLIDLMQEQVFSDHCENEDQEAERKHRELLVQQQSNCHVITNCEQVDMDFEEPLVIVKLEDVLNDCPETEVVLQSELVIANNIRNLPLIPPSWLFLKTTDKFEFLRLDSKTKKVINHICLNKDLSIGVIFPNYDELKLKDKLAGLHEITDYLKFVERWPICVGTQLEDNRFSKLCRGVIVGHDIYKRAQQFPRCKHCRILRNRLQNWLSTLSVFKKKIAQKRDCSKGMLLKDRNNTDGLVENESRFSWESPSFDCNAAEEPDVTQAGTQVETDAILKTEESPVEPYSCKLCGEKIVGCRYVCCECVDTIACARCESLHATHLMLRVPLLAPQGTVLAAATAVRGRLAELSGNVDEDDINFEMKQEPVEEIFKEELTEITESLDPLHKDTPPTETLNTHVVKDLDENTKCIDDTLERVPDVKKIIRPVQLINIKSGRQIDKLSNNRRLADLKNKLTKVLKVQRVQSAELKKVLADRMKIGNLATNINVKDPFDITASETDTMNIEDSGGTKI